MKWWGAVVTAWAAMTAAAAVYQDENIERLHNLKYRELVQVDLIQYPWKLEIGPVKDGYQHRRPGADAVSFAGCDDGSVIDLDKVLTAPAKPLTEGVLFVEFDCSRDGVTHLGIGCDWWFEAYLNGVLCASTMKGGNGFGDRFSCEDHVFFAPVKKGRNLLTIKVKRGNNPWSFSLGRTLPRFPALAKVAAGPWLLFPDPGSMSVVFRTAGKVAAGVSFRQQGADKWRTVYDHRSGQINVRELHRVVLNGLEPGKSYEYRIVLRDPRDQGKEIIDSRVGKFTLPDEKKSNFSFLFLADMQYNPKVLKEYLASLFRHGEADKCDFIVFGGDMCDFFIPGVYDDVLLGALPPDKPLVMLRGNHELRGDDANDYLDYFAWPDNRSYGMFRWGDTAFLVLDTLGKSDPKRPGKNERALILDQLLDAQKEFVRKTVNSPRWQQAARRIVMAHAAAHSHDVTEQITGIAQTLTDEFFEGKNPVSKLSLYLTGHTHQYSRSIPGSDEIASFAKLPWQLKSPGTYIYPTITGAGPNNKGLIPCSVFRVEGDREKLTLKVIAPDGKPVEEIDYFNSGKTVEKKALPKFKY